MWSPLIATLAATLVACATGVLAPHAYSKNLNLLSKSRSTDAGASATANSTHASAFVSTASRPPSCIQNTGVSCISGKCDASMECRDGQCYCSAGGCSSAAGVCQREDNVLVASGIRLRNAWWPAYYMVTSKLGNTIHVSTSAKNVMALFNLYKLPGQGQRPQDFLLVPQASPAYSVSVAHKYLCRDPLDLSVPAAEGKEHCRHTWDAESQSMSPSFSAHPSVQETAVRLWQAPNATKGGALTIRGAGIGGKFMYIRAGSWKVGTRADDPGIGGYWVPDPPLPFQLQAYDGPPCAQDCGSLSVRTTVAASVLLLVLAFAV